MAKQQRRSLRKKDRSRQQLALPDCTKLSTENPPERLDYTEGEGLKVKPFITRIPGHYSHTIRSVDK